MFYIYPFERKLLARQSEDTSHRFVISLENTRSWKEWRNRENFHVAGPPRYYIVRKFTVPSSASFLYKHTQRRSRTPYASFIQQRRTQSACYILNVGGRHFRQNTTVTRLFYCARNQEQSFGGMSRGVLMAS